MNNKLEKVLNIGKNVLAVTGIGVVTMSVPYSVHGISTLRFDNEDHTVVYFRNPFSVKGILTGESEMPVGYTLKDWNLVKVEPQSLCFPQKDEWYTPQYFDVGRSSGSWRVYELSDGIKVTDRCHWWYFEGESKQPAHDTVIFAAP